MMAKFRIEKDFLGSVRVPYDSYYGPETQRSKDNYNISGLHMQPTFIRHYAIIKRCACGPMKFLFVFSTGHASRHSPHLMHSANGRK